MRVHSFIHSVALLTWSGSVLVLSLLLFLVHFICSLDTGHLVELCVVGSGRETLSEL